MWMNVGLTDSHIKGQGYVRIVGEWFNGPYVEGADPVASRKSRWIKFSRLIDEGNTRGVVLVEKLLSSDVNFYEYFAITLGYSTAIDVSELDGVD